MRLPRVQFSVRSLMVAVAIAAMILGLLERRARFARIALAHQMERGTMGVSDLEMYLLLTPSQANVDWSPSEKEAARKAQEKWDRSVLALREFVDYHSQMSYKYERASGRPWLPVASDAPTPPRPSQESLKALLAPLLRES